MGKKLPLKTLKSLGFLIMSQDAINLQAKCSSETETETYKEETEKKAKVAFVLPPSIRPEVWKAFEEHRKVKRSPLTDRARQLTVSECVKIGGDPNELIEHAILRGWKTVFAITGKVSAPLEPAKKRKPIPQNCHCGKPATTRIGDDWECGECITKGQ